MLWDPADALNSLQKARDNGTPEARWVVPKGQALLATQQYDKLLDVVSSDKSLEPPVKASVEALRGDASRTLKHKDTPRQSSKTQLRLDPDRKRVLEGEEATVLVTRGGGRRSQKKKRAE